MHLNSLKIRQVKTLEEGLEVPVGNWLVADGKVVSYEIESRNLAKLEEENVDEAKSILEEIKRKKNENWHEFVAKKQIRVGCHLYDMHEGMLEVKNEGEVFFETNTSRYLKKLFSNFFEKSDLLQEKFKRNKRAYLLYSDPGMGKSALIRNFCQFALKTEGTAVICVDGDVNFSNLSYVFLNKYADDVKRIILVIEDFGRKDNSINSTTYNPSCLNFLDGTSGLFRVPTMILCTTNYVRELGPHLTNRPGRFNKLIHVAPPTDEEIFELVEGIGGISLSNAQREVFRGKKMTPDHVIESIIRHEIEEITLEESVNEVMSERAGIFEGK